MEIKDYIEKYTKEVDAFRWGSEKCIISIPNECYITLKDLLNNDDLIKFLSKHSIVDLESTYAKYGMKYPVANIGFSTTENKWYGWSYKTIFGFGIGSKVRKGDCAYVPVDKEDFIEDSINFWNDDNKLEIHAENITQSGFDIVWKYSNSIPNTEMRGEIGKTHISFPKTYGKGEWIAKTLEDAKQMAIDFVNTII